MVEWDGLENRCGPRVHRGFESLPPRQIKTGPQGHVFLCRPSTLCGAEAHPEGALKVWSQGPPRPTPPKWGLLLVNLSCTIVDDTNEES